MKALGFLRDVIALAAPFWRSEEKWWAWRMLAILLAIKVGTVYVLIQQNYWFKSFYATIETRNGEAFLRECGWFGVFAFVIVASQVYSHWIGWSIKMHWRSFMVRHYLQDWLTARVFYRMQLGEAKTTNPDQRISEDIGLFADRTLDLSVGFLDVAASLCAFTVVLWSLSGTLEVGGYGVPGYMVVVAFVFTLGSSWLTHKLGNPLAAIFDTRSTLEAEFRYGMTRVRDNAETVAFYRGEAAEQRIILDRWGGIWTNAWEGLRRERKLHWFQHSHDQFAILLPFLLAAPRFFSGQIGFGEVMQITAAFAAVAACLKFFITSYGSIAHWRAETRRVKAFRADLDVMLLSGANGRLEASQGGSTLIARDLSVWLPSGRPLFSDFSLTVEAGRAVLVKGPSGIGKSTLLRAFAGIWPYGAGNVSLPAGGAFFVPQRPYLPLGSLRAAVCYPSAGADHGAVVAALEAVKLGHLVAHLDETDTWAQRLSGGEQQRLAFARLLLAKPHIVFLDEATSALDEENEARMYRLLREADWRPTIISIGHRATLDRHHDEVLRLGHGRATELAEAA